MSDVVASVRRAEAKAASLPRAYKVNAALYALAVLGLGLVAVEVRNSQPTARAVRSFSPPAAQSSVAAPAPAAPLAAGAGAATSPAPVEAAPETAPAGDAPTAATAATPASPAPNPAPAVVNRPAATPASSLTSPGPATIFLPPSPEPAPQLLPAFTAPTFPGATLGEVPAPAPLPALPALPQAPAASPGVVTPVAPVVVTPPHIAAPVVRQPAAPSQPVLGP